MVSFRTSGAVLRELACPVHILRHLLDAQLLAPPPKDNTGRFVWSESHVETLRRLLAERHARRQARQEAGR